MGKNRVIEEIDDDLDDAAGEEEVVEKVESSVGEEGEALAKLQRKRRSRIAGLMLLFLAVFLCLSMLSYCFSWWKDYDVISKLSLRNVLSNEDYEISNAMGKLGVFMAHLLVYKGFGIASFYFVFLFANIGLLLLRVKWLKIKTSAIKGCFMMLWSSVTLGLVFNDGIWSILGGTFGFETADYLKQVLGLPGLIMSLLLSLLIFLILAYNFNMEWWPIIKRIFAVKKKDNNTEEPDEEEGEEEALEEDELRPVVIDDTKKKKKNKFLTPEDLQDDTVPVVVDNQYDDIEEEAEGFETFKTISEQLLDDDGIKFIVEKPQETQPQQKEVTHEDIEEPEHYGIDEPYDPRLDLRDYVFPGLDLLEDYGNDKASLQSVKSDELRENYEKIKETLKNFSIEITSIKAVIGPTVTLYEIVPAPGVKISKIKNLEDDIALSLSALGIRIIAPIPGKGTIGIEVPNQNKQTVSMKSMLESERFNNNSFDLPIAFGKTIANESYVVDLAKMPHLLMAGATGQGKSVGLNAIIASLLYKKHPAELKFVMVDPKKVELSLFNKIERHYLAKLPDAEDAIITDTRKVVKTLNSLCKEMDQRYDLLKDAQVKNLKEYNQKFIARKLNPNDGHRYLPYIVLIVDEFADLIMTAGKEVELPIARLAQLARAIGIHLVIATQRPSVNVITGTIKANFPARVAFRVISKIDSRTILDAGGADQLIGRGDMLLSTGSELIRVQCAFIDTPEIERITEFIGSQRAYSSAFMLPEVFDETSDGGNKNVNLDERDEMFDEAARLIVATQQGSTSLIQRKLKLGYNRAGRLIDQLEAAGIVGPFEGSKAREVRVKDPETLERILRGDDGMID